MDPSTITMAYIKPETEETDFKDALPVDYDKEESDPRNYEIESDHISIDIEGSKIYQEKFLEIIKYYNDVVMTNTIVFPEAELLRNEKIIKKMNDEREAINPKRPKVHVKTNNKFLTCNPISQRISIKKHIIFEYERIFC